MTTINFHAENDGYTVTKEYYPAGERPEFWIISIYGGPTEVVLYFDTLAEYENFKEAING
jgi:hypothetical protein